MITTDATPTPPTGAELDAVIAKFGAWAETLSPREQACLAALLASGAANQQDVTGFMVTGVLSDIRSAITITTTIGQMLRTMQGMRNTVVGNLRA